jgi:hypothetical protein
MAGGKHKNISNRNKGYLTSSEPNSPTIASSGYTITQEKQDLDLKSLLRMMIEDFKENISNKSQGYLASSEPNSPTIASPGYPITPEKQDSDLK